MRFASIVIGDVTSSLLWEELRLWFRCPAQASCPTPHRVEPKWSHDDCVLNNVQQLDLTLFPSLILYISPLSLNNLRPPWTAHTLQIGLFIFFHFIHSLNSRLTTSGTWKGID